MGQLALADRPDRPSAHGPPPLGPTRLRGQEFRPPMSSLLRSRGLDFTGAGEENARSGLGGRGGPRVLQAEGHKERENSEIMQIPLLSEEIIIAKKSTFYFIFVTVMTFLKE